jgi:hypothetical protein
MDEERRAFGLHDSLASGTCIYLSGWTVAGDQPSCDQTAVFQLFTGTMQDTPMCVHQTS